MIPLAIAIGIIEDKIANDLTSKDTKARECLEDVKAKISRHKPTEYRVSIIKTDTNTEEFDICDNVYTKDGFLIKEREGVEIGISLTVINCYRVEPIGENE